MNALNTLKKAFDGKERSFLHLSYFQHNHGKQ